MFDEAVTLPSGNHQLIVVELDTTNHYLKTGVQQQSNRRGGYQRCLG
jgi:hypothetical protein